MTYSLLLRAGDIIQTNGLAREYYLLQRRGLAVAQCPVCPRGAIALAASQDPRFVVDWPEYCRAAEADDGQPGNPAERMARAEIITAETMFARYIRTELEFDHGSDDGVLIENWTDAPDRTEPQVVGALRAAAEHGGRAS